jgi:hypothetical protein
MTIENMHIAVKMGLDKTEGLSYPAFETEELDFWINEAIDRYVKTRYSGLNVKGESFEQSQKRTDDLRTLVEEARIVPSVSTNASDKPNLYLVDISDFPANYMFFLNDEVYIQHNNEVTGATTHLRTSTTPCTSDTYSFMVNDPYSEHRLHLGTAKPLRMFTAKGVELITDSSYSIEYYYMKYLRNPATVVYSTGADCDLPDHTHREIVLLTVRILIENIESQRYNTNTVEVTQSE